MKQLKIFAGLMALTLALVLGNTARSDVITANGNYAAIAYSPSTGKWGYGTNYSSRGEAEAAALRNCAAPDARVVTWVRDGFCALALGDDTSSWGTGYSFGAGATNTFARNRALAECSKRTSGARLVLCVCSASLVAEVNR